MLAAAILDLKPTKISHNFLIYSNCFNTSQKSFKFRFNEISLSLSLSPFKVFSIAISKNSHKTLNPFGIGLFYSKFPNDCKYKLMSPLFLLSFFSPK
jgi:hypothetical protein